jgi:hypothetical protein
MNLRLPIRLLTCSVAELVSVTMVMNDNGVAKREFPISSGHVYDRSIDVLLRVPDDTFAVFVQCTSAFGVSRRYVIMLLYSGLEPVDSGDQHFGES